MKDILGEGIIILDVDLKNNNINIVEEDKSIAPTEEPTKVEIVEDNAVNIPFKDVENIKNSKLINDEAIIDLFSLLNSIDFKRHTISQININSNSEFMNLQHEILNGYYILIELDSNILTVLNEQGKLFKVDINKVEPKYYSTIFTSYSPRKICINSKDIYKVDNIPNKNNLYDVSLIIKLFYNKKISSFSDAIKLFFKDIPSTSSYYEQLYNIFQLKDKLNDFLEKHRFMKLINSEARIMNILANIEKVGLPFSEEEYHNFTKDAKNNLLTQLTKYANNYIDLKDVINDKKETLKLLISNEITHSLDSAFLGALDESNLLAILMLKNTMDKYKNHKLDYRDNRLFIQYNSYNNYGAITPNIEIDNFCIKSDDKLVVGSYKNLFMRILCNYSNIPYLIDSANNNTVIEDLSIRIFDKDNNYYKLTTYCLLLALINGYSDPKQISQYIFDSLDTFISPVEIEEYLVQVNNKCPEIIEYILSFKNNRSRQKRYALDGDITLYSFIKLTESDILKSALTMVYDDIESFNNTHKSKINIVSVLNNKIILETDKNLITTAGDILSRKLYDAYTSTISKVKVVYDIYSGNDLNKMSNENHLS